MNRKERRKAKARTKKPLARLGVAMHIGTCRRVFDTPDGLQSKYYWWASENENATQEEIMATTGVHGPFDTEAEALRAAQIAVVGPDCKVTVAGSWDPAWSKPQ
jgi:hypothetical protein